MTQPCDFFDDGMAWSKNIFSTHHNPAVYFTGIEGGHYDEAIAPKAECRERDLPTGTTAPCASSTTSSRARCRRSWRRLDSGPAI
jgi:hypothetical protein